MRPDPPPIAENTIELSYFMHFRLSTPVLNNPKIPSRALTEAVYQAVMESKIELMINTILEIWKGNICKCMKQVCLFGALYTLAISR